MLNVRYRRPRGRCILQPVRREILTFLLNINALSVAHRQSSMKPTALLHVNFAGSARTLQHRTVSVMFCLTQPLRANMWCIFHTGASKACCFLALKTESGNGSLMSAIRPWSPSTSQSHWDSEARPKNLPFCHQTLTADF